MEEKQDAQVYDDGHDGFYWLDGKSAEDLEAVKECAVQRREDDGKEVEACDRRLSAGCPQRLMVDDQSRDDGEQDAGARNTDRTELHERLYRGEAELSTIAYTANSFTDDLENSGRGAEDYEALKNRILPFLNVLGFRLPEIAESVHEAAGAMWMR